MSDGPFFFGNEPTGVDAIVFGALATSVLTPIKSPIRVAYSERIRERFLLNRRCAFSAAPAQTKSSARAVHIGV
jgi:hypothetical protein